MSPPQGHALTACFPYSISEHPMHVISHFLRWTVGTAPAETQTSTTERAAIARFAAGKRALVEVGVWHGVTTSLLKRSMDPAGVLYAIDPFPTGRLGVSLHKII